MKKRFLATIAVAAAFAMSITACGSTTATTTQETTPAASEAENTSEAAAAETADSGETYTVSLSTPIPETNMVADEIREFCDLVNERTDGRVTINPFYSNVLGAQKDMFTAMSNNEIELILDGSITDYYATDYGFLFAPYLVRNEQHLNALLDSEIFEGMQTELAESNIAILGTAIRGTRVLYSSVELQSADDISKLTIRMPDLASYINAWTALGASTQIMGGADVYSALSTGVVNSCEGPYSQGVSDNYPEVTSYLYPTNHITEPYFIYASQAWLDTLPEDLAQIVTDTAAEVMNKTTEDCAASVDENRQALIDAGMTYDDSIDFSPLFEKVRPIYDEKFESGEWAYSYDEVLSYYEE